MPASQQPPIVSLHSSWKTATLPLDNSSGCLVLSWRSCFNPSIWCPGTSCTYGWTMAPSICGGMNLVSPLKAIGLRINLRLNALASSLLRSPPGVCLWSPHHTTRPLRGTLAMAEASSRLPNCWPSSLRATSTSDIQRATGLYGCVHSWWTATPIQILSRCESQLSRHNQNDMVTHFKASGWVSEAQGAVVSWGVTTCAGMTVHIVFVANQSCLPHWWPTGELFGVTARWARYPVRRGLLPAASSKNPGPSTHTFRQWNGFKYCPFCGNEECDCHAPLGIASHTWRGTAIKPLRELVKVLCLHCRLLGLILPTYPHYLKDLCPSASL